MHKQYPDLWKERAAEMPHVDEDFQAYLDYQEDFNDDSLMAVKIQIE